MTCLHEQLHRYVALRRELGAQFDTQEGILLRFATHSSSLGGAVPDVDCVLDFASRGGRSTRREQAKRYAILRQFYDFWRIYNPAVPRLAPERVQARGHRPLPYILGDDELATLLEAAAGFFVAQELNITLRTMIGLAVGAGLRVSEVSKLKVQDVDLTMGCLQVRRSKFRKDRLVPLHPTSVDELTKYAESRATRRTVTEAFFVNRNGCQFAVHTPSETFTRLVKKCGVGRARGRRPTFHSLRHTFAVTRLAAWYREGANVQAKLPVLATYMGHTSYEQTAYYLKSTAELLRLASLRREAGR